MSKIDYPSATSLSQLFRLMAEQEVTDERLNELYTTGILARVFQSDPKKVSVTALEKVLGLTSALTETTRPLRISFRETIDSLVTHHHIVTDDSRHKEISSVFTEGHETCSSVLTQVRNPTWSKVKKAEKNRGVTSATLRELLFFVTMYDLKKLGRYTYFALGTKLGGKDPEVFYAYAEGQEIRLRHMSSYGAFPSDAIFLGRVLGT